MKRKTILLLLLSIVFYNSIAQIKYQEYDLENGLHVILHQDQTVPVVAISVMYHVGPKNEDPRRTGMAQFFEASPV